MTLADAPERREALTDDVGDVPDAGALPKVSPDAPNWQIAARSV